MNKDYDDEGFITTEEEKREQRIVNLKRIGIALLVIIGVIIIIFMFKGCGNKEVSETDLMENTLLEAGKEYFENNKNLLPTSAGDCGTVSLKTLIDLGLIDPDDYEDCDTETTYVKVCMLASKKLHWVAILICGENANVDTIYGEWTEGTESNLIYGKTDIKFMFLGKYLDLTNANLGVEEELWKEDITYPNYKTLAITNFYMFRDKEYIWNLNEKYYYTSAGDKTKASDVNEYYTTSPKEGYTNKDSEDSSVAKWYTTTGGGERIYWVDGAGDKLYKATQPSEEFNYYTNGITSTRYSTRTWTRIGDFYTISPPYIYICASATDPNNVGSYVPCSENVNNPTHTFTVDEFYTCDNGVTEVESTASCKRCSSGTLRLDGSECGNYSNWSSFTKTPCSGSTDLCKSATITVYEWYKLSKEERTYYPSGKSTATQEKIYYKNAPVSSAIKDNTTLAVGYKWYKLVPGEQSGYSVNPPQENATRTSKFRWKTWTDWSTLQPTNTNYREIQTKQKIKLQKILSNNEEKWVNISETFLTKEEMLQKFKDLGYPVNTLADINASGELKYDLKIYYRNKK